MDPRVPVRPGAAKRNRACRVGICVQTKPPSRRQREQHIIDHDRVRVVLHLCIPARAPVEGPVIWIRIADVHLLDLCADPQVVARDVGGVAIRGHQYRRGLTDLAGEIAQCVVAVEAAITRLNRTSPIRIEPVEAPKDGVSVMRKERVVLIRRMKRHVPTITRRRDHVERLSRRRRRHHQPMTKHGSTKRDEFAPSPKAHQPLLPNPYTQPVDAP